MPLEVIMLPRLVHLLGQFELPQELVNKKKRSKLQAFFSEKSVLQTLSGFIIDGNSGFELILLHMRFLKKVKILCEQSVTKSEDLTCSLQKWFSKGNGIESLSIDFGKQSFNFLDSVSLKGPCMLSSIKLQRGGFPSLQRLCFEASDLPEVHIHEGGMSTITSPHLLCPKFVFYRNFSGIQHLKYLNEAVGHEELEGWKNGERAL